MKSTITVHCLIRCHYFKQAWTRQWSTNSCNSALGLGFPRSRPVADQDLPEVLLDFGSLGPVVHVHIRARQKPTSEVEKVEGEASAVPQDSSCTVCLLWWLVIPRSVWDCCVSVFSLCGLCLFIVDSTVER